MPSLGDPRGERALRALNPRPRPGRPPPVKVLSPLLSVWRDGNPDPLVVTPFAPPPFALCPLSLFGATGANLFLYKREKLYAFVSWLEASPWSGELFFLLVFAVFMV